MADYPQLLVYKASAGSGKTFTLAVQYIKQLVEDPTAYRRILAVTFTNKATAEMKTRILEQLYGLAHGLPASEGYLKELKKTCALGETEIRQAARRALHNIIHDYSRFRIETIDSFFQAVLRNLARELELGANMTVELNNADVLSDAVDAMLEKLDRLSPVLGWLLEYIDQRISDDKRWDISGEIKGFGRNILDEGYIEKGEGLRRKLADPAFIPAYRKKLESLRRDVLEQMKSFSQQFFDTLELHSLSPADLKNGARGISSYFDKLAKGKTGGDVRNATVEKSLANAEDWATKTSPRRADIIELATRELMPLLRTAEEYRAKNNLIANSCDLSLRYLNNLRLLTHIDEELRLQNQQHNRFLLSDTNALLHSLMKEGDAAFVYEKIGTSIDTVMIDEFQDTSRMQWENFHLLLEESLAQREGSLIVGDIKQSIYRWRNGDWKILAGLNADPTLRIRELTLQTNWRSEARIVRFNNAFFTAASQTLNQRYEEEKGESCLPLLNAYSDVCQQTAKKTERGYVKLTFLADTKERPYAEATLEELAKETDALIRQGIRTNDIAILVRKNKAIPAIADYFDKHTPYRIVSDEAFRLDASLAVCMMIDGLRYLTSPEDRIAGARLAVAYQREIRHAPTGLDRILQGDLNACLPPAFTSHFDELRLMPLYELLEKLFLVFDMGEIEHQDAYLCAFYDAVTEYMQQHSSEPTAFIAYWDERLHEKTIPSGEIEGIRILSIHKSKGLEYHTVLIPFCDWKMENETNNHLIWCQAQADGPEPFNQLDLVPVNYSSAMAESVFKASYWDERLQLWVDNLNLLYVAFTRACKNLIVWGRTGSRQKGTVSELLEQTAPQLPIWKPQEETDEDTPPVYTCGELCPSEAETEKASDNPLASLPESIAVKAESIETPVEFKQSNQSADFIQGDDEEEGRKEYIRQGQLLHQVFASIRTEAELPQAIARLTFEGVLESGKQAEQIGKLARWALAHPQVKGWYDGTWELYNECSIIYASQEGSLQTRRPDRVMMKDGQVIVVDFKFGKKKKAYRLQVKEYMDLLARMGYTHVEGYLWYVFENELEKI